MNVLKVLSQHLLDYNGRTFGKFMHDIEKEYRERVTANKKMRYEIENLKMQVQEAEKELTSMIELLTVQTIWPAYGPHEFA
jgi:cell division septum initiation protein DivIVA